MITVRGQILVSRTGPALRVRSKRLRVHRHHAHMLKHMCAWCPYTRRRFECTHGAVFESTHGFSTFFFRMPQHTQTHTTTTNNTTTITTQHHTTHNITRRQRQREREKEREKTGKERQDETRQDETRQDKTRQNKTRQHNTIQHNTRRQ